MAGLFKAQYFSATFDFMAEKVFTCKNGAEALAAAKAHGRGHNLCHEWEADRYVHVMVEKLHAKRPRIMTYEF